MGFEKAGAPTLLALKPRFRNPVPSFPAIMTNSHRCLTNYRLSVRAEGPIFKVRTETSGDRDGSCRVPEADKFSGIRISVEVSDSRVSVKAI
jgi:hypothetical protein